MGVGERGGWGVSLMSPLTKYTMHQINSETQVYGNAINQRHMHTKTLLHTLDLLIFTCRTLPNVGRTGCMQWRFQSRNMKIIHIKLTIVM